MTIPTMMPAVAQAVATETTLRAARGSAARTAFRRMARLYAPDVNPDPSVTHRFEEILEA